jgi:PhnB protein
MTRLSPYLRFDGNCKEAMEFYKAGLGGQLNIMTVKDTPQTASQMPPNMQDKVMHSMLEKDGMVIMGSDNLRQQPIIKGNTVTLSVTAPNKKDIEDYFRMLSQGGKITQSLEATFFGVYGSFTDKFGIEWMFQADKP